MPWSFIVPAALSVFGANKQASAAKDAAAATQAATDAATQLQREMYQQTRADQAPFRQGGLEAQNRLMTLLGIGGQTPAAGGGGGGSGVVGAVANAVRDSGAVGGGLNIDPNSPDYGKYARDFSMADFTADPGYAFRLSEGQKALDRSAAARGGLISGGALKAAGRYGQDMASQEFTNAFNRYQTNRSNQLNPLQSLMGAGQTSTNQLGAAGQNYASNVGNALINQGANVGNARMAGASAYGSALSGIGSAYGRNPVSFGSLYGGGGGYSGAGQVNPVSGEYMGSLEF
jgi:Sec-independent protein translocase protein TatA